MSSPPPLPKPIDGDVSKGQQLLAIFWTEIAVATIFVALRLYVRRTMRSLGWDDWTMLITLIMYIVTLSLCSVLVHYGLGRHIYYIPPQHQAQVVRWNWIVQPFGILTLPFGKVSVALLLLRLMGPNARWRKWILWGNMGLFTVIMVLAAIFSFVQCNPPRALWEKIPTAKCWDPEIQANWAVAGSAYSSFLDFFLALMPITIVWNLKLSIKKRIGLCILLGLGVLSGICAAIKTAQSRSLGVRTDVTWALFSLYAWSSSEIFLNIICGCAPTLNPLYDWVMKGTPLQPNRQSKKYSYSYGSSGHKSSGSRGGDPPLFDRAAPASTANVELGTRRSSMHEDNIAVQQSYNVEYETLKRDSSQMTPRTML